MPHHAGQSRKRAEALGPRPNDVRVLFVSVDPERDTLPVLKSYVNVFAPEIDGCAARRTQSPCSRAAIA
jgi:cytochrome oxidase Cu insertion factor (SCO1/SenC/PrrC family)